ncbi:ABC transporter substrate-binding protein [Amycolatopsis sp. NPDC004079]|uniref:ABC transporter substrate-binding protein n=1 Tax=Amycolatopsis sp. NPDC004079 TaxID=3154549 RepID=UPI0033B388EE
MPFSPRSRARRARTCITAVAMLVLAACDRSPSGGTPPGRAVSLEYFVAPSTFDPAAGRALDDYIGANLLFSTLTARDFDGTIIPNLASGWSARSASEYSLTIRDDAVCADGTKITPAVVAASLAYYADNGNDAHPSAAPVFGLGKTTITADDAARTVSITLGRPNSEFLAALSVPQAGIICPAGLADKAGLAAGSVRGAFSGPYTLGSAKPGAEYSYDLRPGFTQWVKYAKILPGVPPGRIVFGIRADPSTTASKLLSGGLDIGSATGDTIRRFAGRSDYNRVNLIIASVYVAFNETPGRYFAGKPEARKAVAQAIDRAAFTMIFSNDLSPIFNSVIPRDYKCALEDPSLVPAPDPAAAAAVLRGATVKFPASMGFGDRGKGADYLQKALTGAGAAVELTKHDNASWVATIQNAQADWDMTLMSDVNALNLMSPSLTRVIGPSYQAGGRNVTASKNPDGEAAVAASQSATDPRERCRQFKIAQRSVLSRQDVVPLAGIASSLVSVPDVTIEAPAGSANYATIRLANTTHPTG